MATSDLNETARERTGERLLRSSATMTYDPIVDIDWDAPLEPDRYFAPPHRSHRFRRAPRTIARAPFLAALTVRSPRPRASARLEERSAHPRLASCDLAVRASLNSAALGQYNRRNDWRKSELCPTPS